MSPRPVAALWLVAALVLLAVGGWCVARGIVVQSWTGGLLTAPVRQVQVRGGWLVVATVAATAAILVGVEGVGRLRGRR